MAFACAEDPESVGGPVTDGYSSGGLSSSSSNGASINSDCWGPVIATGFAYFSIQRLVIGISYALNSGGGGGGNGFADLEQQDGCHNITGDQRYDIATAAFVFARSKAITPGAQRKFGAKYRAGSTFELKFPDNSVARYEVGAWRFAVPLVAEKPNSCQ